MLRDIKSDEANVKRDGARIFVKIVGLGIDKFLLFSSIAMLNEIVAAEDANVNDKRKKMMQRMEVLPEKLDTKWIKIRLAASGWVIEFEPGSRPAKTRFGSGF